MAIEDLFLGDLGTFTLGEVSELVTEMTVSYTMDGASEVSFTVIDPNFTLMSSGYFQVRQDVVYGPTLLSISSVEVSQSDSMHPQVKVEARSFGIGRLKRDKDIEAYANMSGTEYAALVAQRHGMNFVGEPSTSQKAIFKASGQNVDESAWTVLQRAAGDNQFVVFESDGTLFFASQLWLMGRYGNVTLNWPPADDEPFQLTQVPTLRTSDDDPLAGTFQAQMLRQNATQLRPGMTVNFSGIPQFGGQFLITEVSFREGVPDPVSISGRTPAQPRPETTRS